MHIESLAGTLHGVVHTVSLNPVSTSAGALASAGLGAVDSWVLGGARGALRETADVIGRTTSPQLDSTWFSATYWRVAGLAALLTLPFLFAAATQALLRSDLGLLARAAFLYLPLAAIGVGLAAPMTMLLLAATDQMCAVVSAAGSGGGAAFLTDAALAAGGTSALDGSAFLAFAVGLFTVAGAIALAIEMLIREAAVYVVVLMLPLAFAAFVWPARRIWAVRALELLIALILSKFAVVAVLSLAGAAYGAGGNGPTRLLTAMALVTLAAFAPWGLLRLLPFTELAAGAAGEIHSALPRTPNPATALAAAGPAAGAASVDWAESVPALMADQARHAGQAGDRAAGNGTGVLDADLAGAVGAHPSGGGGPAVAAAPGPCTSAAASAPTAGPTDGLRGDRSTAGPGESAGGGIAAWATGPSLTAAPRRRTHQRAIGIMRVPASQTRIWASSTPARTRRPASACLASARRGRPTTGRGSRSTLDSEMNGRRRSGRPQTVPWNPVGSVGRTTSCRRASITTIRWHRTPPLRIRRRRRSATRTERHER